MSTYIRMEFVVSTVDRHTLHTSQRSRHNFTNNVAIPRESADAYWRSRSTLAVNYRSMTRHLREPISTSSSNNLARALVSRVALTAHRGGTRSVRRHFGGQREGRFLQSHRVWWSFMVSVLLDKMMKKWEIIHGFETRKTWRSTSTGQDMIHALCLEETWMMLLWEF